MQRIHNAVFVEIVDLCPSLETFISDVRRIKPPQSGETDHLKHLAVAGDTSARKRLTEIHLPLAVKIGFQRAKANALDIEDTIADACIGLLTAVDKCYMNIDGHFAKFASFWIRQNIKRKQSTRSQADCIHSVLTDEPFSFEEEVEERIDLRILHDAILKVLSTLSKREEEVISARFGFGDGMPKTLADVGEKLGVTRERIRQIEKKALQKLGHPTRSRFLKPFVEGRKSIKHKLRSPISYRKASKAQSVTQKVSYKRIASRENEHTVIRRSKESLHMDSFWPNTHYLQRMGTLYPQRQSRTCSVTSDVTKTEHEFSDIITYLVTVTTMHPIHIKDLYRAILEMMPGFLLRNKVYTQNELYEILCTRLSRWFAFRKPYIARKA